MTTPTPQDIARAQDLAQIEFFNARAKAIAAALAAERSRWQADCERLRADNTKLRKGLTQSVNLQSHYAELLDMHVGGNRLRFASADEWLARLDSSPNPPQQKGSKK